MDQLAFLKDSLSVQNLAEIYNTHIVPRLTKRNKVIGISTAVVFSLVYLIHDRLSKPPKNLRHFAYQSYYTAIRSAFKNESARAYDRRVTRPIVEDEENNGLYVRPFANGWNIMVANPELAKIIFLKTDIFPRALVSESINNTAIGRFNGGHNMAKLNGPEWKSQRNLANPAFHRSMPVNLFGNLTLEFFEVVDKSNGCVDFTDLIQRWTLDAIGKAGFGFNFNAISKKDNDWVKTYNTINEGFNSPLYFLFPFLDQQDSSLLTSERRKIHGLLDRFLGMIDQVIVKKREAVAKGDLENDYLPENEKDLLTLMIEGEMRGEGAMSNEDLKGNVCLFFLAGHDTTANTLAFAIYYLATHPELQEKAREEAIRVLGDEPKDILPTLEQTRQFVYINQVIKETLRINGPVSRVVSRVATEDYYFHDKLIPKGSLLNIDFTNIHLSKKLWKDPYTFDPERFSEEGEATTRKAGSGMTWLPFGSGSRQCIGMNFSLYEQRVFLSMLLRKYTWKLPKDSIHRDGVIPVGVDLTSPAKLDIDFERRY